MTNTAEEPQKQEPMVVFTLGKSILEPRCKAAEAMQLLAAMERAQVEIESMPEFSTSPPAPATNGNIIAFTPKRQPITMICVSHSRIDFFSDNDQKSMTREDADQIINAARRALLQWVLEQFGVV